MRNTKQYAKRLVLLASLGVNTDLWEKELKDIYLISPSDYQKISTMMRQQQYKQIITHNSLNFLQNLIEIYHIDYFGNTHEEKMMLSIKKEVFSLLTQELGELWTVDSLWKHPSSPFCKSIIGTLYYYGINRIADKNRGEDLLEEAASMGDIDALLWHIWKHPEKAQEYMENLVSLPESLANPEWLNPWKKHYRLWDVKEKQLDKPKIGF